MYNGIGLQTVRGSGTNGHVQKNCATVRPRHRRDKANYDKEHNDDGGFARRPPNREILAHARKRQIEVKCAQLADNLELQGWTGEEVEAKVTGYRELLQRLADEESEAGGGEGEDEKKNELRPLARETHQVAEASQRKNELLRGAFGISESYVPGSGFDRQQRAEAERKTYELVRTPESSGDEDGKGDVVWRKEAEGSAAKKSAKRKKEAKQKSKKKRKERKKERRKGKKRKVVEESESSTSEESGEEGSSSSEASSTATEERRRRKKKEKKKGTKKVSRTESKSSAPPSRERKRHERAEEQIVLADSSSDEAPARKRSKAGARNEPEERRRHKRDTENKEAPTGLEAIARDDERAEGSRKPAKGKSSRSERRREASAERLEGREERVKREVEDDVEHRRESRTERSKHTSRSRRERESSERRENWKERAEEVPAHRAGERIAEREDELSAVRGDFSKDKESRKSEKARKTIKAESLDSDNDFNLGADLRAEAPREFGKRDNHRRGRSHSPSSQRPDLATTAPEDDAAIAEDHRQAALPNDEDVDDDTEVTHGEPGRYADHPKDAWIIDAVSGAATRISLRQRRLHRDEESAIEVETEKGETRARRRNERGESRRDEGRSDRAHKYSGTSEK